MRALSISDSAQRQLITLITMITTAPLLLSRSDLFSETPTLHYWLAVAGRALGLVNKTNLR